MSIHQEILLHGSPEKIYTTLMTGEEFGKATGAAADIQTEEGDRFSCFDGKITGRHIELSVNRMIVQAWRATPWETGLYSIVRMSLLPVEVGTKLTLDQVGFPSYVESHLESGWHKMYWEPLDRYCR